MVERLIISKKDESGKGNLSKVHSFNTEDDDDSLATENLQQTEHGNSQTSKYDLNLLAPVDPKRSLLSLNSPSIDSVDPEGSISDNLGVEKIKKRKRRPTEKWDTLQIRRSISKKQPWYTKIDSTIFIKPLIGVGILILIYLMWVKRDVWIPRLLTSNTRIRHTIMKNEEKLNERGSSSQTSTTKDSLVGAHEDNIVDDNEKNNDQTSIGDNDDSSTTYSKSTSQKINLKTRRNKMSFSKDRPTKKTYGPIHHIIDGDDDDDDDDDDDKVNDGDDDDDNDDEIIIEPIKVKESVIPSSIHSSKKHQRGSGQSREQKVKPPLSSKTTLILRPHDDIVDQLYKLVKSRGKNRDLLAILTKQTGLNKGKINRFIYGKDFSILTLDLLISFLNSYDSTLLIVPK